MIPAVSLPLAHSAVGAGSVPRPPSKSLPAELDVASPYLPQTVCDPPAKPGVTAFARLMARHYDEFDYGISRHCDAGLTEHSEGRALDWMLNAYDPHERAVADSVVAWLVAPDAQGRPGAMARRFGVMYIIWDRKIWGTYQMGAGWRPYTGSIPHTDHIHLSFSWDGAMQRTSWWTGRAWTSVTRTPSGAAGPVVPATPESYPTLRVGSSGADVALAQKVIGTSADGQFGPATQAALRTWQKANQVPVTGVLDVATWARMVALGKVPARGSMVSLARYFSTTIRIGSSGEAVRAAQKALRITADGEFGPQTAAAVKDFQRKKSLAVDGVVRSEVWKALAGLPYRKTGTTSTPTPKPTGASSYPTLRVGARGSDVALAQKVIGTSADGQFGPATQAALRTWQKANRVPVTGVLDPATWARMVALRKVPARGTAPTTTSLLARYYATTIRQGSSGAAVTAAQRALRITADGAFGPQTAAAVRAFQKKKSLTADGVVTRNVWKALAGAPYTKTARPGSTTSTPTVPSVRTTTPLTALRSTVLTKGARGAAVKTLQRALGGIAVDGVFGSGTERAVRALQTRARLRVTGIVDARTWEALEDQEYPLLRYRTTVLRSGSTGAAVVALQRALGITADGSFGPQTRAAVMAFQGRHALARTGVVASVTWEALERAASTRRAA